MASDRIALRRGELELELCPGSGGVITRLRCAGRDLLRPATRHFELAGDAREAASFPLVPFSNRIENGQLNFRGRRYTLAPNMDGEPHAIHGQGWQLAWQIAERAAERAVLELEHAVPGTPFVYRARQSFELRDSSLELGLSLENRGLEPMPAGLGMHPYFERGSGATLQAHLDHVWLPDEDRIPRSAVSLPSPWDFSAPRAVDGTALDHCFGGWDGRARIAWPQDGLALEIESGPPLEQLVLYLPPREPYFCVEPVSHAPDAFNLWERGLAHTGTQILSPGEHLAARVSLRAARL